MPAAFFAAARSAFRDPCCAMNRPNMSQSAFARIRDAIVTGRLDFGEPLSESSLSSALGMSKAPVRTALMDLQSIGLVRIVPMSGSYVASPGRDEVIELCDHRLLLERQALLEGTARAGEAMARELEGYAEGMKQALQHNDVFRAKILDGKYHACFFRHAGNRYLSASYEAIRSMIEALRFRFMDTAIYRSRAHEEHEQMVAAIRAGDTGRLMRLIEVHINRTKDYQSGITWQPERLTRKDYKSRNYAEVFQVPAAAGEAVDA